MKKVFGYLATGVAAIVLTPTVVLPAIIEVGAAGVGFVGGAFHTVANYRRIPNGEFGSELWSNMESGLVVDVRDTAIWQFKTAQKTIEKIENN